jgi:hypothetical protein
MESLCGELRSPASFFGIFLARRALFASTLVWIADLPGMQLGLTTATSMLVISYLIKWKLYISPAMNRLELFNEVSIYLVNLCAYCYGLDADLRSGYIVGWVMIGLIGGNMTFNLLFMFIQALVGAKDKIRAIYKKLRTRQTVELRPETSTDTYV